MFFLAAGAEPVAADAIAAVLAEEFLRMLLLIFSERTMAGKLSHEQLIERAIVSRLALGPASFSQLAESLPEALTQHKAYERVLAHVADFVDPKVT